jgi:hypothetical protein
MTLCRPRVIWIESEGSLVGLLTIKDGLRYTLSHPTDSDAYHAFPGGGSGPTEGADELELTWRELRGWWKAWSEGMWDSITGRDRSDGGRGRREVELEDEVELEEQRRG